VHKEIEDLYEEKHVQVGRPIDNFVYAGIYQPP